MQSKVNDPLDLTRCCPLEAYANAKKLRSEFLHDLGVE